MIRNLPRCLGLQAYPALPTAAHAEGGLPLLLQEQERLQREIQQLNDTVFSKSFKAPSAWAEREVKYKMEKRAWEQQVASLKEQIKTLLEENHGYRESNKAAEFESQVKVRTSLSSAAKREPRPSSSAAFECLLSESSLRSVILIV